MSYIPDVVLPEKEVDDIEVREYPDDIDDSVELQQLEEQGVEEEVEPLPPPPQKKEKLKKEDIFKPKKAPPKKVSIEPQPTLEEPIVPKIEPVKKKRQLTEKQKAALAKGRAARAANKKQVAPAPERVAPSPAPAPVYQAPAQQMNNMFTKEQLQEVIFQGVNQYDTMRKKRKEEKRKTQAAQNHTNKVYNDIQSQLRVNDPWASAFNF